MAVLEKLPAENPDQRAALRTSLSWLGPDGIRHLCSLLVAPGDGDDSKPRMALHALALCSAEPVMERVRRDFLAIVTDELESDADPRVKAFLIRQLQIAGGEDVVPWLAGALGDEKLCLPATQALLAIGGEEAARAFRQALPNTQGRNCVAIIDALGLLRDKEAGPLLLKEAASKDRAIRWAALSALAGLGQAEHLSALEAAPEPGDSPYQQSQAQARLLAWAAARAQMGNQSAWESVAQLAEDADWASPECAHLHCAVLYGLAQTRGAAAAGRIVQTMASENPEIRAAAVDAATILSGAGATEALVSELPGAPPAVRTALVTALQRRGDAAALPAVLRGLYDADRQVRLAAIPAAAALGQEAAIPSLVTLLDTDQEDEREAAAQALARIGGKSASQRIATAIGDAPPRVRVALLDVLARRHVREQLHAVYASTRHADEAVRLAAIRTIEVLADHRAAPKLLDLLAKAEGRPERQAIEQALAATCRRADNPEKQSSAILAALQPQKTADYCSLLRVLGRIGGGEALGAVRRAMHDDRDEVRTAAFQALLNWPDPAAADDVLVIARETETLKHHVLAMRAYARLVPLDEQRSPKQLLTMYQAGIQVARRPEEKKLLLSGLGEVHDARTLPIVEPYLADEALHDEAAVALVSVADGLLPHGWAQARKVLDKVLTATEVESVRQRANEVMQRVCEYEDFITDWRVAGPYTEPGKRGNELADVAFLPEQPDATNVQWHRQPVTKDAARYWHVDLLKNRSIAGSDRAAYLATRVYSPVAQEVLLQAGSDDGITIWINGRLVHRNNALRGCQRGQDEVRTTLKADWNDVLLKVTNDGGGWGACLRVRGPDGSHLDGVYADADHEDQ